MYLDAVIAATLIRNSTTGSNEFPTKYVSRIEEAASQACGCELTYVSLLDLWAKEAA